MPLNLQHHPEAVVGVPGLPSDTQKTHPAAVLHASDSSSRAGLSLEKPTGQSSSSS